MYKDETIHIIGAGIAGLMLGYFLKKKNHPFIIYEKSDRVGGLIHTRKTEWGIIETAANGIMPSEIWDTMMKDLELKTLSYSPSAKNRYIYKEGVAQKFVPPIAKLLSFLTKSFYKKSKTYETIADFGNEYFGSKFTQEVIEPALGGIYAAKASELSLELILPEIYNVLDQQKNLGVALIKKIGGMAGAKGTQSFEGGMQAWIDRLADYLKDHIQLNYELEKLENFKNYIFCTPAYVTRSYFAEVPSIYSSLSFVFYQKIISVKVFFKKSDIRNFDEGFGVLFPRLVNIHSLGILYNHCIFNENFAPDIASFTCIINPDFYNIFSKKTDQEIFTIVRQDLLKYISQVPDQCLQMQVDRIPNAIPLYSPSLASSLHSLRNDFSHLDGLGIFGNYTGVISIRNMAESAKAFADSL